MLNRKRLCLSKHADLRVSICSCGVMMFREVCHGTREASSCQVYGHVHRPDVRQFLVVASCGMPCGGFERGGFCLGWGFCDECIEQPFGIGFRLSYSVLSCGISAVLCNQGYLLAHFWSQGRAAQDPEGAFLRHPFDLCSLADFPNRLADGFRHGSP